MGRKSFTISEFYCIKCGNKGMPIARSNGNQREGGHMKKLYCITCKRQVNHVEIKPFSEYDYDRFISDYNDGKFKEFEELPQNNS